jgi:hypothetical protein
MAKKKAKKNEEGRDDIGRFKKGNVYAQVYDMEELTALFLKGLEYAQKTKDCLCLADAIHHTGIPYSTYDWQAEKHAVLGQIKKDTMVEVTRRINKGGLMGDYNPTASIWRMKQLGERDEKYQDVTTKGEKVESQITTFQLPDNGRD